MKNLTKTNISILWILVFKNDFPLKKGVNYTLYNSDIKFGFVYYSIEELEVIFNIE
ncbi:hypothetical protein [Pseudotamlana agarivorans]|uniref:hypothetical protein n=1 Tax=Pseudotamlana agarivorans TaxID=481183 RepID=UPI000A5B988F|nr:hypothetical protein [Tamlana agarivorans]